MSLSSSLPDLYWDLFYTAKKKKKKKDKEIWSFFHPFNVFLIGFAFGRFESPLARGFSATPVGCHTGLRQSGCLADKIEKDLSILSRFFCLFLFSVKMALVLRLCFTLGPAWVRLL